MEQNTLNDLFGFLTTLMNSNASLFQQIGRSMFRDFALILIAWFGIQTALHSAGGAGHEIHTDKFAALLIQIGFGLVMITFYSQPIPGIGLSFYQLVVNQGLYLANILNQSMASQIGKGLSSIYLSMDSPALSLTIGAFEVIRYTIVILGLLAAQITLFVVIAFGYIASSVCVLTGPLFIPFFIVPHMEFLFWGWFKAFIQFSFYPVIANAFVYVFGSLLLKFVGNHPPPYDGANLAVLFIPLVMLLVAFVWGLLQVPRLVNAIFTGSGGDSAYPTKL